MRASHTQSGRGNGLGSDCRKWFLITCPVCDYSRIRHFSRNARAITVAPIWFGWIRSQAMGRNGGTEVIVEDGLQVESGNRISQPARADRAVGVHAFSHPVPLHLAPCSIWGHKENTFTLSFLRKESSSRRWNGTPPGDTCSSGIAGLSNCLQTSLMPMQIDTCSPVLRIQHRGRSGKRAGRGLCFR